MPSLSLFGEREDCGNSGHVRAYARCACGSREQQGGNPPCDVWKESSRGRRKDSRRRERRKDEGRRRRKTGPTLSAAAIRQRIHGNIEHVHRSWVARLRGGFSLSLPFLRSSLSFSCCSSTSGCSNFFTRMTFRNPVRARPLFLQHVAALRGRCYQSPPYPQQLTPAACPSRVNARAISLHRDLYLIG